MLLTGGLVISACAKMLRRASVSDIRKGNVTGSDGHIVVAMRVYPRFLARSLVSEYLPSLAPAADLFARYRALKRASGDQNAAFEGAEYQRLFELDAKGLVELERLSRLSAEKDVYLVCQCDRSEFCHVDLMLLIASQRFGAEIGDLAGEYAAFRRRIE